MRSKAESAWTREVTRLGGRRDEHVGRSHPAVPTPAQASETLVDVLGACCQAAASIGTLGRPSRSARRAMRCRELVE
jgi:hypothetical protein